MKISVDKKEKDYFIYLPSGSVFAFDCVFYLKVNQETSINLDNWSMKTFDPNTTIIAYRDSELIIK